ncbi:MAG TPA: hypothetical protein PK156_47705 [Polyangium sp.]|nr:hypothetical protein [Polyangium sp.]
MRPYLLRAAFALLALTIASSASAESDKKSPPTKELADKLLDRGALAEASRAYAAFAREFPKDPRAPRAFADAVILNSRLKLVDLDIAQSDSSYFENTFVPMNIEVWSEMSFTLIDGFTLRNDSRAARTLLHRTLAVLDDLVAETRKKKTHSLQLLQEIEIGTRRRLARAYTHAGDHKGADAEYARVRKIALDAGVWPNKKPARNKPLCAETMDTIAEALFYAAEQKRFEADHVVMPSYRGMGDRDSVLLFVNGPGRRWYENREYAVKEAHRYYALVVGAELPKPIPPKAAPPLSDRVDLLGGDPLAPDMPTENDPFGPDYIGPPVLSPLWAIAAAERVGSLWSNLAREFRTMPVPKEWKQTGLIPGTDLTYEELKGQYITLIDPPDETQKMVAKYAYRACLELSIRHRIVNGHTDRCIDWLAQNYGAEYKVVDEFMPPGEFFALGRFTRPANLPLVTH